MRNPAPEPICFRRLLAALRDAGWSLARLSRVIGVGNRKLENLSCGVTRSPCYHDGDLIVTFARNRLDPDGLVAAGLAAPGNPA